ncbi:MAG: ral stress protein 13 [Bacillales bacterium]|jgi:general stress protein 13|nr:ral stress protein 13 [Bacillales bacterium]
MNGGLKVGDIVIGKITGVQSYGAFVEINSQTQGLIHISEISERFVRDISDFVSLGEEVRVKILSIDPNTGKLSLSIKELQKNLDNEDQLNQKTVYRVAKPSSSGFQILKRKLDEWIKQSVSKENLLK